MPAKKLPSLGLIDLPEDVILIILRRLDVQSLVRLSQSCKLLWDIIKEGKELKKFFKKLKPIPDQSFMYAIQCEYIRLMKLTSLSLPDCRKLGPFLDHTKIATKLLSLDISLFCGLSFRMKCSVKVLKKAMDVVSTKPHNELEQRIVANYFIQMRKDIAEKKSFAENRPFIKLCVRHRKLVRQNFEQFVCKRLRSDPIFMIEIVQLLPVLYECTDGIAKRSIRVHQAYTNAVESIHPHLHTQGKYPRLCIQGKKLL